MLNAEQARNLAGVEEEDMKVIQEELEAVNRKIREAALNKKRSITIYGEFWRHNQRGSWKKAKSILEELGYTVYFYPEQNFVSVVW